jgi:hypothetical protein
MNISMLAMVIMVLGRGASADFLHPLDVFLKQHRVLRAQADDGTCSYSSHSCSKSPG